MSAYPLSFAPAPNGEQIAQAPQNALAEFARVANLKQQTAIGQQQQQAAALENQQRQIQLQDQQAGLAALKDPDFKSMNDLPDLIKKHGGSFNAINGARNNVLEYNTKLQTYTKDQLGIEATKNDAIAGHIDTVKALPPEQQPAAFENAKADLVQRGYMTPQEAQATSYPGPQGLDALEQLHVAHSAQVEQMLKTAETQKNQAEAGKAGAEQKKIEAETGQPIQMPADIAQMAGVPEMGGKLVSPAYLKLVREAVDQGNKITSANGHQLLVDPSGRTIKDLGTAPAVVVANIANNTGAGKTPADVAKQFGMTQEAFDQQAEKYFTTGVLPPVGRGGNGMALQRALMNRTAELHSGESLAGNEAAYKANAASLKKLQTNFDQVSAFENTAQKNLDLYLDKLNAIPDLGVKFANIPMRMIDDKLIGSDNYQAMKAAQQTAAAETAKVLSSANASGVLSDSQKKEAEDILSGNLSYSAAKKVVATLKQDFANRHQSYQAQIGDIQKRIGGAKPSQSQGNADQPKDFFSQFGGKPRS